jgi:hypothetical protein
MPDKEPDILAQFQEFLSAKEAADKEAADSEDFDVEIWDEKGRGVRTKRSHAKPFLQSLGIDLDPEPTSDPNSGDDDAGKGDKSKSRKTTNPPAGSQSMVRKYFTKAPAK